MSGRGWDIAMIGGPPVPLGRAPAAFTASQPPRREAA
jgi:hypothetical protein